MSKTVQFDIPAKKGATFRHRFRWMDARRRPINVTGCTARLVIVDEKGTSLLTLTEGHGIALGDVKGTVTLVITDEQTAHLPMVPATYTLTITFTNGESRRLLEGQVIVS